MTISRLPQWLKGETAHHLLTEFPRLKKRSHRETLRSRKHTYVVRTGEDAIRNDTVTIEAANKPAR